MKNRWVSLTVILALAFIAGCQTDTLDADAPTDTAPDHASTLISTSIPDSSSQETATPDRINNTMTKMPERVPPTEAIPSVTGEVPTETLDLILKDLADKTGATIANITVMQAQQVVWNDGSLGCPQPGVFYTQALVNGYWVVLEFGGKKYDYRVTGTGYFFLCENGLPPISFPATPSS